MAGRARRDASSALARPRSSHGASLRSTCRGSSQAAARWVRAPPRMPTGMRFARQGARRTTTHGAWDKERTTQSGGKLSKANAARIWSRHNRADPTPELHRLPGRASPGGLSEAVARPCRADPKCSCPPRRGPAGGLLGAVARPRRAAPECSCPPRRDPAGGLLGAVTHKRSCGCHMAGALWGQACWCGCHAAVLSMGAGITGHHCAARRSRTSRDAARPVCAVGEVSLAARSVSSGPMLARAARTACRTLAMSRSVGASA